MGKSKKQQKMLSLQRRYSHKLFIGKLKPPFECPRCSRLHSFTITHLKGAPKDLTASCTKCNLNSEQTFPQPNMELDYYSKLYDQFNWR
jgi:transcription elongation factor Elf1